jgi:hypothetical protein
METLRLSIASMLPLILGIAWLRGIWHADTPGAWPAILGYGYILGMVATALVMLALDTLGAPQHFALIAGVLGVLTAAGLWATRRRPGTGPASTEVLFTDPTPAVPWQRVVMALLLGLIALRFAGFALEIAWRPLFPWDAWMNWALKSRVWFEHGQLVPYISPSEWATGTDRFAYTGSTLHNTHYPPLIPLIQLWMALGAGYWSETLINLPWLLCGIALVSAFYGQARALGSSPLMALVFCYLLVSMPFLGIHVALAGYAELWLAALYALAAMAFLHWAATRHAGQGILAIACIAALPFVKQPGIAWAVTFIPALLVAALPFRWLAIGTVVAGGALAAFYFTTGIALRLPQIGRIILSPEHVRLPGYTGDGFTFHAVWDPFVQNLFVLANWHLLWFLVPVLLAASLPSLARNRELRAGLTLALTALAFLFIVFFFTRRYSAEALNYTTINRAIIHMVPALLFVAMMSIRRVRIPFRE